MDEKELKFEDLLDKPAMDSGTSGSKPSYLGGNIYIQLPEAIGSLTPTARCVLDELKDWHKRVDKQGGKEPHPTYLLTVDKLPESLVKYSNIGEQAKSEASISQAIKQILDLDRKGMNRVAYAYPFLIRNGNKIASKIALIAPQKENKTDVSPYRQACFRYSEEMVNLLIKNRAKKGRAYEENITLTVQKNKEGKTWLFPKLASLEAEIGQLVRRGFGNIPAISLPDFLEDCMEYGRRENLVVPILDDYHIVIDPLDLKADGSYNKVPEVVNQILLQINGLIQFGKDVLIPYAEEAKYEGFKSRFLQLAGSCKFQSLEEKMQCDSIGKELVMLLDGFPFSSQKGNAGMTIREPVDLCIRILKNLIEEKNKTGNRQEGDTYENILKSISDRIPEYTRDNLVLYPMQFDDEIKKSGISDPEKIKLFAKKLKDDILSEFSYHEAKNANGTSVFYVVDHGYMTAVLHKLTIDGKSNPELRKQLDYAKKKKKKLTNPKHPELNGKLKPDLIAKLMMEIDNEGIRDLEDKKQQDLKNKINVPFGVMAFFVSALAFVTAAFIFETTDPFFFGIPFSIILGILVAIFFREKSDDEIKKEVKESGKFGKLEEPASETSGGSHGEKTNETKEDKIAHIYKSADSSIFPKKFNKITEKVLDPDSLKKRIEANLDTIKKNNQTLEKEKDNQKVISTIEYAVLQSSATILVPNDILVENMPASLIISRSDLKSELFRQQLADAYREDMEKKKLDKKMVKYYTYLINTIEMEYFKYLPKKK